MKKNEKRKTVLRKKALIRDVSIKTGYKLTTVTEIFEGIFDTIKKVLLTKEKERIKLGNCGILYVKEMKPVKRRNPGSGETFIAPKHSRICYKPSEELRKFNIEK